MSRYVHIVINPASGQPQPILHTLNKVFRARNVDWNINLTKQSGDAERFAREAAQSGADAVAAFGGDGTIMEVARGLMNTSVPMAILPGGTANLVSVELGIPKNLEKAVQIAADETSPIRQIDAGMIGNTFFLLRVGLGIPARKVELADRNLKDRWGIFAYTIAAIKALKGSNKARYRLTIDGEVVEIESLLCQVYNAGNMGKAIAKVEQHIDMTDGKLDLLVLKDTALVTMLAQGTALTKNTPQDEIFHHWQAREFRIEADPPQSIQVDGEIIGSSPVDIKVLPKAVSVLVGKQ